MGEVRTRGVAVRAAEEASRRVLGNGDEPALEAFLAAHADTSMFLRSNLRRFGVEDGGQTLQGTYAASFQNGGIAAVAAHYRNGVLVLQAPAGLASIASTVAKASGRAVRGLVGLPETVREARAALGLSGPGVLDEEEDLFALELAKLAVPSPLADGSVRCRLPEAHEVPLLVEWRAAYSVESLGATPGDELNAKSRREIEDLCGTGDCWVLRDEREVSALRRPVAFTAFNARLPEIVQVGGVYTPPVLRGRGYARAAVAGSLLEARERGATRAVLFTSNPAARRSYEALGFVRTGSYALVLFGEGVSHVESTDDPAREG